MPRRPTILLLVLLALTAGCGGGEPASGYDEARTIRFGTYAPVHKFDPHLTDGGVSFSSYNILVYDGLLIGNPESLWRPLPNLATEWNWITATSIEFRLRNDVHFSDGVHFDASAAKANFDRMLGLRGPRFRTVASIKDVEVVDDYTLRIHLHQYDPAMLRALTGPPGSMVSPAAFDNADLDLNPVGSGPWLYDKENSTIGEVHRFKPRPGYHMYANPSLANVEVHQLKDSRARLNALISGEIDVTILRPVEAKTAEELGFAIATRNNRWFGLTILDRNGELVPELADVRVRQAIGFAVDRQAIADAIYFGYARPASQPMVEEYGYVPELDNFFQYDPEYARQLLDEAGVESFTFVAPVLPDAQPQYEAVQHYLRKVGINMEIEIIESTQHGALSRTTLYPVNTHTSPSFDPDNRHRAIWGSEAVFNPFRVITDHTDRLAEEAMASPDEELRYRNYAKYFDYVVKEGRTIIYLQVDDIVAYDPEKLTDVDVSGFIDPMLRFIGIANQGGPDD
jgi:peptide/nickel transport system substrate-binding protein